VKKAEVKARLVTRTYTLQSDRAKFNNSKHTDICQLCKFDREDTDHFLLECSVLQIERDKHMSVLTSYVNRITNNSAMSTLKDHNLMTQFILDCSNNAIRQHIKLKLENRRDIENITRTLCYSLHTKRSSLLST